MVVVVMGERGRKKNGGGLGLGFGLGEGRGGCYRGRIIAGCCSRGTVEGCRSDLRGRRDFQNRSRHIDANALGVRLSLLLLAEKHFSADSATLAQPTLRLPRRKNIHHFPKPPHSIETPPHLQPPNSSSLNKTNGSLHHHLLLLSLPRGPLPRHPSPLPRRRLRSPRPPIARALLAGAGRLLRLSGAQRHHRQRQGGRAGG